MATNAQKTCMVARMVIDAYILGIMMRFAADGAGSFLIRHSAGNCLVIEL
jgi:hypothetical protein